MAKNASKEMSMRLKEMLTRDKIALKDGFICAVNGDLNRLLDDYFELTSKAKITIEQNDSGEFEIHCKATASRIKSFDSTADLKRF